MEGVCACWMSNGDILGNRKECKRTKRRASVLFSPLCGKTGKRRTLFPWMPNRYGPSDQCDADSQRWVRRIQMPLSALSPSWETDRPLPSLLTAQPSLSLFSFIGLISFFFLKALWQYYFITDECLLSVFPSDTLNQISADCRSCSATLERKCLQAVQSMNVYIYSEWVIKHCTDKYTV